MPDRIDYYKLRVGKRKDELYQRPTAKENLERRKRQLMSAYPLVLLGRGEENLWISEEERESHMHIIGTTGEGKSKFLEWLMRSDVDRLKADEHLPNEKRRSIGFCFLDPSDRGDTMYKVLAYCQEIGYDKVLVIDPHHRHLYKKIAPINPLEGYKEAVVASVLDTFRVLFNVRDAAETARIQRYLTAIVSVLWNAKCTLHDSIYFTEPVYAAQRTKILERSDSLDRHRLALEEVFKSRAMYLNELQSTVRRLEPLYHPTLDLMFSSREGINFTSLIGNGWVVLVNLYAGLGIEPIHTRLLGTMVINEIINALDRIKLQGWEKKYYLYIDEAGRYANRNLADLLAYKRKSGLRVIISHQYWKQFEDPYILEAVKELCKIKIAFFQPDPDERLQTVKAMFGGELKDRDVNYSLSSLRKQHAVIKKPKKAPMVFRVRDVPDLPYVSESYLREIYSRDLYTSPEKVIEEQKERLNEVHYATRASHPPFKKASKAAHRPNSKTTAPHRPPDSSAEQSDPFRSLREDEITYPTNVPKQPSPARK